MPTIGRDPQKTKNELAAGESGAQAVQGASTTLQRTYESGQQNAQQMASTFGGLIQQGEDLKERKRSDRMHEAQVSDQQDIEKADRGLQSTGTSRADQLNQEMERGRQQKQLNQPLEVQGPQRATISQTPERLANEKAKAETEQLNASAKFMNASRLAREAKLTGNKEAEAAQTKSAGEYVTSAAKLYDTFKTGKADQVQWDNLARDAKQTGDPALQQEIQDTRGSGILGKRTSEFLQRQVDSRALSYISLHGDIPEGHQVDMSSPMMNALTQTASGIKSYLAQADALSNGMASMSMGVKSLAERNRLINQYAAQKLTMLSANPTANQQQDPIPSQGGPSAQPPVEQRARSEGIRAGADPAALDRAQGGAPIESPDGGPPVLRGRSDILRSAGSAESGYITNHGIRGGRR